MHRLLPLVCALALSFAARAADSDEGAKVPAHQKHHNDPKAPKTHGKMIKLKMGDDSAKAYVARPKGAQKGAILVMHEWWGLNAWVKHEADLLADHGYLALAIDLYKGKVATDPKEAGALMGKLDEAHGDRVEEAGIEWLKQNGSVPKVFTIGWCMGGGQSLRASLHDAKDIQATVMYYGMPVSTKAEDLKKLGAPVLGIWANKDGWITPAVVAEFDKGLTEANIKHEFHAYDADHAFANPSNGEMYKQEFAADAWEKTLAFLDANATEPGKGAADSAAKSDDKADSKADKAPAADGTGDAGAGNKTQ